MKVNKKIGLSILMAITALGLVGCSFEGNKYSPEEVINNALDETETVGAYYSEEEIVISEKGEVTERFISKQWHSEDGKLRIESEGEKGEDKTIAVNDGSKYMVYLVDQNEVLIIEDDELPAVQPSLKEQATILLKMVEDTHTISIEGEEKVLNRMAYHLVAKANEANSLMGDIEMWIDKENWMALKTISINGDTVLESVYKKIDFDAEIPADKFTIDLPEDVKKQDMNDISKATEITIEDAKEAMGKKLVYLPETDEIKIAKIEMTELGVESEMEHKEVSVEYEREGLPLFTLSFFVAPEESSDEDLTLPGEEDVTIRGEEGSMMDLGDFRTVFWQEDEISYSVILINPNFSFDEFIELTNDMAFVE